MRVSGGSLRAVRRSAPRGRRGVTLRELLLCLSVGCLPLLLTVLPITPSVSESLEMDEQNAAGFEWSPFYDIMLCGEDDRVLVRSWTRSIYECTDHFSEALRAIRDGRGQLGVYRVAPDGATSAEWTSDGCLVRRGAAEFVVPTVEFARAAPLAFSPDSRLLALSVAPHEIAVWDLEQAQELGRHTGKGFLLRFVFTGDSRSLMVADASRVQQWTFDRPPQEVGSTAETVFDIACSASGRYCATAGARGELTVWDLSCGSRLWRTIGHGHHMYSAVAISPCGNYVAVSGYKKSIELFELHTGKLVTHLRGHSGPVNDLAFAPHSGRLCSSSTDGTLRVWDVTSGSELALFENPDACRGTRSVEP